jgi:hypothetical protein
VTKSSVTRPESCMKGIPWPVFGSFWTDLLGRITGEVSQRGLDYLRISKGEGGNRPPLLYLPTTPRLAQSGRKPTETSSCSPCQNSNRPPTRWLGVST